MIPRDAGLIAAILLFAGILQKVNYRNRTFSPLPRSIIDLADVLEIFFKPVYRTRGCRIRKAVFYPHQQETPHLGLATLKDLRQMRPFLNHPKKLKPNTIPRVVEGGAIR